MKAHNLTYQESSSDPVTYLGTVFPASTDAVLDVLAAPQTKENEHDGRSEWVWIRLANGDLVLAIFPQGGVYEMVQGAVERDYEAAHPPAIRREIQKLSDELDALIVNTEGADEYSRQQSAVRLFALLNQARKSTDLATDEEVEVQRLFERLLSEFFDIDDFFEEASDGNS